MAPRITLQLQLVLRALVAEPTRARYGLELSDVTGLPTGTIYPILARLEGVRWVESTWEEEDAHPGEGRPRRRYYQLTQDGVEEARSALAKAHAAAKGRHPWLGTARPEPGGAR
jgi:PadR family transcriptional regulator PadR